MSPAALTLLRSGILTLFCACFSSTAFAQEIELARDGKTDYSIIVHKGATLSEKYAAEELGNFLSQITGASFPVHPATEKIAGPKIIVGPGNLTTSVLTNNEIKSLGDEGLVIRSHGSDLILAGGRKRGSLYAVYTFLEDTLGCRWWTSTVNTIPHLPTLRIPPQFIRQLPSFEYREAYSRDAFDPDWAVRNKTNGKAAAIDKKRGGHLTYKGFVHTFNLLVPPEKHFDQHPEWFSEVSGKRKKNRSQLCLTNQSLKDFVVQQVRAWLRESPDANIVSVSQNDWLNRCTCTDCAKLEATEGAPSGPMLHFVNYVAGKIENEFPHVAISTLAYQYTRKPPQQVRPRSNVIIRLCSIECSFAHPLDSDTNTTFRRDLAAWSNVCKRLYVWDYVTNYHHYIQPHPNLRVMGPNLKFFKYKGVKGVFEQGNRLSKGGEFAELRAWVLAKLLWNPDRDAEALVDEFINGYYTAAAPSIRSYIKFLHDEVEQKDHYLSVKSPPDASFLSLDILTKANDLFDQAEQSVADQPEVLKRVKLARLPLQYVWIKRWAKLKEEATASGITWPFFGTLDQASHQFFEFAKANQVNYIAEGKPMADFEKVTLGLKRKTSPTPAGCEKLQQKDYINNQDDLFQLTLNKSQVELIPDKTASDGVAARMPGTHHNWAVQKHFRFTPIDQSSLYRVFVTVKCETTGSEGNAFTCGIWNTKKKKGYGDKTVTIAEIEDSNYHDYELGTFPISADDYLWIAPAENPKNSKAVWVDRIYLIKAEKRN